MGFVTFELKSKENLVFLFQGLFNFFNQIFFPKI